MRNFFFILMVIALVIVGYETFFRPEPPFPTAATSSLSMFGSGQTVGG